MNIWRCRKYFTIVSMLYFSIVFTESEKSGAEIQMSVPEFFIEEVHLF